MNNDFREDVPAEPQKPQGTQPRAASPEKGTFADWARGLIQIGLGESLLRAGTHAISILGIAIVIWLIQLYSGQAAAGSVRAAQAEGPAATPAVQVESIPAPANPLLTGILRTAQVHTNIPTRPRQEIVKYKVQPGDSVFGIAEKYGLQPQTILWGNYNVLYDDPHNLQPGQELNILPVDGVYYEWSKGDTLAGWAKTFGVKPEDIIAYPGNHFDLTNITDYSSVNIEPGTWLIVPGGQREFTSWFAPTGVTRNEPASARVWGPGACEPVSGGAVGYGAFVWPTNKHYLSGFDYSPKTNHWGIDIAGSEGEGVYATDAGVVVYSGWNNYGYGNMIMIDHGNGWQSLYAHLSATYRFCGQSVGQGEAIGAIGSTGHSSGAHLHFEIMTPTFKTNPWDLLPPS